MVTLYIWDAQRIYSGLIEADEYSPMPNNSTITEPPTLTGAQVAQWNSNGWIVLPERPPAPAPAPEPVPQSITMRQARRHLLDIGRKADVDTAINNLPEPQRSFAQNDWEYSQVVDRQAEFVSMLAPVLGWDSDDLDIMFIEASKLTA